MVRREVSAAMPRDARRTLVYVGGASERVACEQAVGSSRHNRHE